MTAFWQMVYSNAIAAGVWWAVPLILGPLVARKTWRELLDLHRRRTEAIEKQTAHLATLARVANQRNPR